MYTVDGKDIILLAEGRLVNLDCATGHQAVMSASFTPNHRPNRALEQSRQVREQRVHLAQALGREGRTLALGQNRCGNRRAQQRAGRLHQRSVQGPFKGEAYRY